MWNTVIFDLDGTLTESGPGIKRSVQYALSAFGLQITTEEELNRYIGPPLKTSFQKYAGFSPEDASKAVGIFRERYTAIGIYENALYPEIENLLAALKCHGFRLAVASSKPDSMVRFVLQYFGIDRYFDVVVGSPENDETSGKAVRIADALYRLGLKYTRDSVVYIGDRAGDIEGARLCGIEAVGAGWGYGTREELLAEHPAGIADSVEALLNILLNQAGIARQQVDYRAAWAGICAQAVPGKPTAAGQPYPVNPAAEYADRTAWDPARMPQSAPLDGPTAHAVLRAPLREHIMMKIWRCVYPLLLYEGLSVACAVIFGIAISFSALSGAGGSGLRTDALFIQGIADAAVIVFCIFFMRRDERRRRAGLYPGDAVYRKERPRIPRIAALLIFTLSVAIVVEIVISLAGIDQIDSVYSEVEEQIFRNSSLLEQVLVVVIVGPIAEELVFRGLLFRRLNDYLKLPWAVIISSALFGLTHGNLVQGIFAGTLGIALAVSYADTGKLIVPILGHMANNALSVFLDHLNIPDAAYLVMVIASALLVCILTWYLFFEKKHAWAYDRLPGRAGIYAKNP